MRIRCEVLAVENLGDKLRVKLQGRAGLDAEWRNMLSLSIEAPDHERHRRAFFVGRIVYVEVEPA